MGGREARKRMENKGEEEAGERRGMGRRIREMQREEKKGQDSPKKISWHQS